ncbi:MAG: oligosaccharide flippase family protein [Bacteroidales bacterium]|nr:oligosaccharide flippase family protein [Bacteroidales bacterium]
MRENKQSFWKNSIEKYRNKVAFRRFISLFSTDVLVRGANFLLIPLFLYLMTRDEFGVYGYLYSFAMAMSLVFTFGFHASVPKLYADTKDDKKAQGSMLFTLSLTLILGLVLIFSLISLTGIDEYFFGLINRNEEMKNFSYDTYRPYLLVAMASMVLSNLLTYYFVAAEKIKNIQAFNLIRFFFANGLAILLLYTAPDADAALLRLSVTYIVELLLCCVFLFFLCKNFTFKFSKYYLYKGLKIGLPLSFVALLNAITNFGDKHFVMIYCGAAIVGVYNLASLLATIPVIVYQSFNFIWLPSFLQEKNLILLKKKTDRNGLRIFILLLLLSVLIYIGAFFLLQWGVFPENYSLIMQILPPLLLSQIFASLNLFFFNYFTYFEKNYLTILTSIVINSLSYLLFSLTASRFGYIGVAYSLLLSNFTLFVIYYILTSYYVKKGIKNDSL